MKRGDLRGARGAVVSVLVSLLAVACASTPAPTSGPPASPTSTGGATTAPASPSTPATAAPSLAPSTDPSQPPATIPPASGVPATMPPATELEAELAASGTLTVCLALLGAPAAAIEDGEPAGYNVAFARELASRMGLTLQLEETLFAELASSVQSHACDVSVSSQNITQSRLAGLAMTPYTKSLQPVLVRYGNPLGILEITDLCGRPVSTTTGSTHVDYVDGVGDYVGLGLNDQCATAGLEPVELQTFQSEVDAVAALVTEEVEAYLGNPNFIYDYPDDLSFGGPALPPARQGIATALDRPLLTAAVQAALSDMIGDGTYMAILREYLLSDENAQASSILE